MSDIQVPAWGSEESIRKERHVARFLEREYRNLMERPISIEEIGVSAKTGLMWEKTEELVGTHYDERVEFFESFLDRRFMAYSMAYYSDDSEKVLSSAMSLEEAQEKKFDLICQRIGLQGNEKILNVGCGFGSFERYVLKKYSGVEVTSITPSRVQASYIRECVNNTKCGIDGKRIRLIEDEFSGIDVQQLGAAYYDVVLSIGLLEHVRNMEILNEKISMLLRPGGYSFHHYIVSRMPIPQFLEPDKTLIGSYFPGGRIWPIDEFPKHDRHLAFVEQWFINGLNYWKTLDEWHRRFWEKIQLLQEHMSVEKIRYWNDYFLLCKACFLPFSGEVFGNAHYLFQKPS